MTASLGRFVYTSNRGHDSIFIARLDGDAGTLRTIGHKRRAGRSPREIAITPNGCLLLAASQDDDLAQVFTIHQHDGTLSPVGAPLRIGTPVCPCFVPHKPAEPMKA